MAKLGVLTLSGESGKQYEFNVYNMDTEFNAIGAVYCVSERTESASKSPSHSKIYIGQTGDLSTRFDNHHKADCFQQYGANCISVHKDGDEDSRLKKEKDLIAAYNLPCND